MNPLYEFTRRNRVGSCKGFFVMDDYKISLSQGKFAIVDEDDFENLMQWKWHYTNTGYARRNDKTNNRKAIKMHRYIMDAPEGMDVDHINGNGLDNRKSNLRIVTHQNNQFNMRSNRGSSKYKGVSFDKQTGLWRAYICISGKLKALGRFSCERQAGETYNKSTKELHGEFCRLNIIEGENK